MITLKKWIILESKDRTWRAEGREEMAAPVTRMRWGAWCCVWHNSCCSCAFFCGKALKLSDTNPKCRFQFWLGPVIQLLKSSLSKKYKLVSNALESDRHSRVLSTSCDWMEDVFFPHTFSPSEVWHGWGVNGKITVCFPLLCLLQMVNCFSVELLEDRKQML